MDWEQGRLNDGDGFMPAHQRHVVIIGAGFGGLACAYALGNAKVSVTVLDRRNYNLFQPLLYQVATAALSPADISEPIRKTLGRYRNIGVLLGEVTGIDTARKQVLLDHGDRLGYDQLVIATGSEYNYFGHNEWRDSAPGLKSIHEARLIRQRLLMGFEQAERATSNATKQALLTSITIGGGPTGVEMAGAISELGRDMLVRDFRHLSPTHFRVILVEAGPRILSAFPEQLSAYAQAELEKIGVEVRTSQRVTSVAEDHVMLGSERIPAGTVIWGAGVKASPALAWLGLTPTPGSHIPVDAFLRVEGFSDIYAMGDTALALDTHGGPLPALAQVAKQQGIYLGKSLRHDPSQRRGLKPFHFHNRGNTAVIGRHAAVFDFGRWQIKGRLAWFLWAFIHVYLLVNFEKRVLVAIQWSWRYFTRQRSARLIDEGIANDCGASAGQNRSRDFAPPSSPDSP